MSRNTRLAMVGTVSVLALALSPAAALADGGHDVIRADLVPSNTTDPLINGVAPGGRPWIIDRGEVRVRDNGRMDVRIEGLQIPGDGTAPDANPVPSIVAVLYCDGMQVADSGPRPMSVPGGDARFRVSLNVPDDCDMASVLISPDGRVGQVYIASAVADEDDD